MKYWSAAAAFDYSQLWPLELECNTEINGLHLTSNSVACGTQPMEH